MVEDSGAPVLRWALGMTWIGVGVGCSTGLKDTGGAGADGGPGCATALLWVDEDLDGFGDPDRPEEACVNTPGHAAMTGDCDDTDGEVHPAAPEICNGIDDDCDGEVDMGLLIEVWSDLDGDGFGDPDTHDKVCVAEEFHVRDATDCDDTAAGVFPGADEICDGIDQNCDGDIDEEAVDRVEVFADVDMDGMGDPGDAFLACPDTPGIALNDWDCDDADPTTPVVVDAGSTGEAGSLSEPLGSIQAAVDVAHASAGDACVVVLGGLYNETLDLSKDDVFLVGVEGADQTVVDGYGLDEPVLTLGEGNQLGTLVEGLTLTQGTPKRDVDEYAFTGTRQDWVYDRGAGVFSSGARATLRGLSITDNRVLDPELSDYTDGSGNAVQVLWFGYGGGVYADGGTLVLEDCLVGGNEAARGAGIYTKETLFVLHSRFWNNIAAEAGGAVAIEDGIATLDNTLFSGNVAPDASTLVARDSTVLLSQLTVFDDVSEDADGALIGLDNVRGLWSNLILSAVSPIGIHVADADSAVALEGVLFDRVETPWDAGVRALRVSGALVDADPLFLSASSDDDPSNDDLHLNADSPAVDAGISGRDPDGSAPDLGAYGGVNGTW